VSGDDHVAGAARALLRSAGAVLVRYSSRSHEVWRVTGPKGRQQVVLALRSGDPRVGRNALRDVRRALRAAGLPLPPSPKRPWT